jgi:hypothetical protein
MRPKKHIDRDNCYRDQHKDSQSSAGSTDGIGLPSTRPPTADSSPNQNGTLEGATAKGAGSSESVPKPNTCLQCGRKLPSYKGRGRPRTTCNDACRQRKSRFTRGRVSDNPLDGAASLDAPTGEEEELTGHDVTPLVNFGGPSIGHKRRSSRWVHPLGMLRGLSAEHRQLIESPVRVQLGDAEIVIGSFPLSKQEHKEICKGIARLQDDEELFYRPRICRAEGCGREAMPAEWASDRYCAYCVHRIAARRAEWLSTFPERKSDRERELESKQAPSTMRHRLCPLCQNNVPTQQTHYCRRIDYVLTPAELQIIETVKAEGEQTRHEIITALAALHGCSPVEEAERVLETVEERPFNS